MEHADTYTPQVTPDPDEPVIESFPDCGSDRSEGESYEMEDFPTTNESNVSTTQIL